MDDTLNFTASRRGNEMNLLMSECGVTDRAAATAAALHKPNKDGCKLINWIISSTFTFLMCHGKCLNYKIQWNKVYFLKNQEWCFLVYII